MWKEYLLIIIIQFGIFDMENFKKSNQVNVVPNERRHPEMIEVKAYSWNQSFFDLF